MKHILPFLSDLAANNHRDWFLDHRKEYELAKGELLLFLEELIPEVARFDQATAALKPKDCIFRINRDVRFSNDKSPYKNNMGAVIAPGGKKSVLGCYYVHLQPGHCFLAGGVYVPEAPALKNIREEIDYNLPEFEKILNAPAFKKHFDGLDQEYTLKTNPKGYTADNPAIPYLKNKSFTVSHPLKDSDVTAKNFLDKTVETFAAIHPLNAFLDRALNTAG